MNKYLKNTVVLVLLALGLLIYIYIFNVSFAKTDPKDINVAVLEFAKSMSVTFAAFIGAILGIESKKKPIKKLNIRSTILNSNWKQILQYIIIGIYLIILVIGLVGFLFYGYKSSFIKHLFTTTIGLMLGVLGIVLSPTELEDNPEILRGPSNINLNLATASNGPDVRTADNPFLPMTFFQEISPETKKRIDKHIESELKNDESIISLIKSKGILININELIGEIAKVESSMNLKNNWDLYITYYTIPPWHVIATRDEHLKGVTDPAKKKEIEGYPFLNKLSVYGEILQNESKANLKSGPYFNLGKICPPYCPNS